MKCPHNNSNVKSKILIVDDHELFRDRLRRFISETSDMAVTDEAGNGHEALDKASKNDFDMVILDINMPGISGLDVLEELKIRKPYLSVLMLSMFPLEHYELSVMKAGGDGYVTKDNMTDELIKAMRQILNGGKYFNFILPEELRGNFGIEMREVKQILHANEVTGQSLNGSREDGVSNER